MTRFYKNDIFTAYIRGLLIPPSHIRSFWLVKHRFRVFRETHAEWHQHSTLRVLYRISSIKTYIFYKVLVIQVLPLASKSKTKGDIANEHSYAMLNIVQLLSIHLHKNSIANMWIMRNSDTRTAIQNDRMTLSTLSRI